MNTLLIKATVNEGEIALAHDEFDKAELAFRSALTLDPENAVANAGLGEIARARGTPILRVIDGEHEPLSFEQTVRLAVRLSRLLAHDVSAREGMILARLAGGPKRVDEMLYGSDAGPAQVLDVLERFVQKGILAVD